MKLGFSQCKIRICDLEMISAKKLLLIEQGRSEMAQSWSRLIFRSQEVSSEKVIQFCENWMARPQPDVNVLDELVSNSFGLGETMSFEFPLHCCQL